MYACDFEYDGHYLSDFGMVVCDFDGSNGMNVSGAGSVITFNTVPRKKGERNSLTSTQYDECITATFSIGKDPCEFDDQHITNDEYRDLMRWLNRKEFLPFRAVEEGDDADTCYFDASFNISKIKINERLYGLELTMITDKPFGYGMEQIVRWRITSSSTKYLLSDVSDEIGYIYPNVKIRCNKDGDLKLTNIEAGSITQIKNVSFDEVITIDGDALQIETSLNGHKIYDDFNYEFPKIVNSYNDRSNHFTASLPCNIEIRYRPIIKDSI